MKALVDDLVMLASQPHCTRQHSLQIDGSSQMGVQGYLAHKKTPTPLESPLVP